jgi:hypothetical protein
MTDVEAAAKTIIEDAGSDRERVTIISSIADTVVAALRAVHPKRMSLIRTIVNSSMRHAPIPEVTEGSGTSVPAARLEDHAVERARERLAKLRGEF